MLCRTLCKNLSEIAPTIKNAGFRLCAVGPERLGVEQFLNGKFFDGEVYVDEGRHLYKAIGARRLSFVPALIKLANSSTRQLINDGKRLSVTGDMRGDKFQLGGLIIAKEGGKMVLQHMQREYADFPSNQQILDALKTQFSERIDKKTEEA